MSIDSIRLQPFELEVHSNTYFWYHRPDKETTRLLRGVRRLAFLTGSPEEIRLMGGNVEEIIQSGHVWGSADSHLDQIFTVRRDSIPLLTAENPYLLSTAIEKRWGDYYQTVLKETPQLNEVYSTVHVYHHAMERVGPIPDQFNNNGYFMEARGNPQLKPGPIFQETKGLFGKLEKFLLEHGARLGVFSILVGAGVYSLSRQDHLIDGLKLEVSNIFSSPPMTVSTLVDFFEPLPITFLKAALKVVFA